MRGNGYKWQCGYCGHVWVRAKKGHPTKCPYCHGKKEKKTTWMGRIITRLVHHGQGIEYQGRAPVNWRRMEEERRRKNVLS